MTSDQRKEEAFKRLSKERDELYSALQKAYRAACHFMVCSKCADNEPCVESDRHIKNLADCDPMIQHIIKKTTKNHDLQRSPEHHQARD